MEYTCEFNDCQNSAYYNTKGSERARFCSNHRMPGMADLRAKACEEEECNKSALYNFDGNVNGRFCFGHRLPGMINVNLKRCNVDGCNKVAYYSVKGSSEAQACLQHRLPNMVSAKQKICEHELCTRSATFSFEGDKPRFCVEHRTPDMINVKTKRKADNLVMAGTLFKRVSSGETTEDTTLKTIASLLPQGSTPQNIIKILTKNGKFDSSDPKHIRLLGGILVST